MIKLTIKNLRPTSGDYVWTVNLIKALEKSRSIEIRTRFYFFLPVISILFLPLLKLVKDKGSDIIQSGVYGFAFKKRSVPLVIVIYHVARHPNSLKYSTLFERIYRILVCLYERKTLLAADKIVSISKYTRESLRKIYGFDSTLIYCGIDTKIFKPLKRANRNEKTRLLFVGNLSKRKGVDLLPKIMDKLGNNYELYYTSGLRTDKKLNHSNMIPLGKLNEEDLIKEYDKCDILLFPSRLEGFGYAVAEAMACGKPIVATNCSSLPELVVNGKGGFLCEMDNVNDFVKKIEILTKNEKLRKGMGRFNRQRIIKKFNLEKMGKEYQKLYNSLIDNHM